MISSARRSSDLIVQKRCTNEKCRLPSYHASPSPTRGCGAPTRSAGSLRTTPECCATTGRAGPPRPVVVCGATTGRTGSPRPTLGCGTLTGRAGSPSSIRGCGTMNGRTGAAPFLMHPIEKEDWIGREWGGPGTTGTADDEGMETTPSVASRATGTAA